MADEQKPDSPQAPPPAGGAAKPAPPKPAAPAAAAPPKAPAVMAATPWDSDLAQEIKERFGDQITEASTYLGQNFIIVKPDAAIPVVEFLKLEGDFDYLVDLTAVDWPKREARFDLVYILYSFARNERVRVKTNIVNLYVAAPDTGAAGPTRTYTISAGEMSLVAELYDSETGEVLARVVDRREARRSDQLQYTNSVTNQGDFREIASGWARILRSGLDKAHGIGKK